MNLIDLMQHGPASIDAALGTLRIATGTFFVCSGANKLFVPSRHATLRATLEKDKVPALGLMEWWVPMCEFGGGLALAVGFMTSFVAGVLAFLLLVALKCEGKERVAAYQPINAADRLDDWLYLPECTYLLVLFALAMTGGGAFSVDAFF